MSELRSLIRSPWCCAGRGPCRMEAMIASGMEWLTGWDSWMLVLWVVALPIVLVYATARWLIDRMKR